MPADTLVATPDPDPEPAARSGPLEFLDLTREADNLAATADALRAHLTATTRTWSTSATAGNVQVRWST
jgi:hypothetical protein